MRQRGGIRWEERENVKTMLAKGMIEEIERYKINRHTCDTGSMMVGGRELRQSKVFYTITDKKKNTDRI